MPAEALSHFDYLNIMAYDATGNWGPDNPGQHPSLEFAKEAVTYWITQGLPKDKAVLGVPFYGYGFGSAFRNFGYPYAEILELHPDADQHDKVSKSIWYNSNPTIRAKSLHVLENDLGGIMIWSLDQDAKGEKSLLKVIHQTLNP